jgi:hypothetical protein
MFLNLWRKLMQRPSLSVRARSCAGPERGRTRTRPLLEPLEERTLLSTFIQWDNEGGPQHSGTDSDSFQQSYGANAPLARSIVEQAIHDWEEVLSGPMVPVFHLNVVAVNLGPTLLGQTTNIKSNEFEVPDAATIQLDDDAAAGGPGGWFFDPTPADNSEFTQFFPLQSPFAANGAPSGTTDFYKVILHEMGHALGLSAGASAPDNPVGTDPLAIDQFLEPSGFNDPIKPAGDTNTYPILNLPGIASITTLGGYHVFEGAPGVNLVGHPLDLMNPGIASPSRGRVLISDLDAAILHGAYGYGITLPSTIPELNYYADFNVTTGVLSVNGDLNASPDDSINIVRVGDSIKVTVDGIPLLFPLVPAQGAPLSSITVSAGTGNNSVDIDLSGGAILPAGGTLTVTGAPGSDTALGFLGPTNPDSYILNANTLTEGGSNVIQFAVTNVNHVNLETVGSGNYVRVDNTPAVPSTFVYPGGNNDHVDIEGVSAAGTLTILSNGPGDQLEVSAQAQNLDAIQGPLSVFGTGGSLLIHDQLNTSPHQYTLDNATVVRDAMGQIAYQGFTTVQLDAGLGGNTINVLGTAANTATTINAGTGQFGDVIAVGNNGDAPGTVKGVVSPLTVSADRPGSRLHLNDQTDPTPYENLTVTATDVGAGGDFFGPGGVLHYSGLSSLDLFGGFGGNTINVLGTAAPTTTVIDSGQGIDTINVGSSREGANTLDQIQSSLTIDGQQALSSAGSPGLDRLFINDQGASTPKTATVTGSTVGAGPLDNIFGLVGAQLTYLNIELLTFNGGSGGNTFNVQATHPGTATVLNAGTGTNLVVVSPVDHNQEKANGLTVHGGGSSTLIVDDQANPYSTPASHFYVVTPTVVGRFIGVTTTYDGIKNLTLNAGNGGNVIQVLGTPTGASVSLDGGGGTNTLGGPAVTNDWQINSGNGGKLNDTTTFSHVQNLVGGAGGDTFRFLTGGSLSGSLKGQAGTTNTLNYAAYKGDIVVNLRLGQATAVAGVISGVQNVTGSMGNDLIVGDANLNVIHGGTGRNILIGGGGSDVLDASSSTGDNILIGGTTDYDSNSAALGAIFAEWNRTNLGYHDRFSDLTNGTNGANVKPLNVVGGQLVLLNNQTVHADTSPDMLTGTNQIDPATGKRAHNWFFYDPDDMLLNYLASSDHKTKVM